MKTRVIYYDLSEWLGDSKEFNTSLHRGILAVSVTYPDNIHRHILSGRDYYYVKDDRISIFDGDEKEVRVITLRGVGKETVDVLPVSSLDLDYIRMGVWVDDRTIRTANRRILEREE